MRICGASLGSAGVVVVIQGQRNRDRGGDDQGQHDRVGQQLQQSAVVGTTGNLGAKGATDPRHIPLPAASTGTGAPGTLGYSVQTQPSLDNNTVDLDRERANFVDNAVRYEATLRFINGNAKTMLSAIQGQ